MKKTVLVILVASLLALGGQAFADLCTIDAVPAATLLLPYFEVDTAAAPGQGVTTLFSLNNASATAAVAHVVLWTNWSQPTLDFDVYLTGFDVVTVNLYDLFVNGNLPITADDQSDPVDAISPQGPISQDISFNLPFDCGDFFPFYDNPMLVAENLTRIRNSHTGKPATSPGVYTNRCFGADLGDSVARGYITMDNANGCSLLFPSDTGYFADGGLGFANNVNQLWGDYFIVDPANNFAFGETLVHVEADSLFNAASTPTAYTFYGRYTSPTGSDNREPLGTTWASRYLNGGVFDGGTDLIVWRDSTADNQPVNGFAPASATSCGNSTGNGPNWFRLNETEVIVFDEEENAVEICFATGGGVISPPTPGSDAACFPYEAGRYAFGEGDLSVPFAAGWVFLNLNLPSAEAPTGDVDFPAPGSPIAQSYVATTMSADGRFQVGFAAIQLTSACEDVNPELNASNVLETYP